MLLFMNVMNNKIFIEELIQTIKSTPIMDEGALSTQKNRPFAIGNPFNGAI